MTSIANIIKLEPGGMELAGMPPRVKKDDDTELARTMPVNFFIKLVPWRMEAWSSRGCRRRAMVDSDTELTSTTSIINIIKLVSRRMDAWSSRDDATDVYVIKMEPATRSHKDDAHPRAARNMKLTTQRRRWRYTVLSVTRRRRLPHDAIRNPEPKMMRRDGGKAMQLHQDLTPAQ